MEQNNQNKGKKLLIWAAVLSVLAIIAALPLGTADDKCMFGYIAVCPFVPVSSLILLAVAFYLLMMRKKQYISN